MSAFIFSKLYLIISCIDIMYNLLMKIKYLESVDSTHTYLKNLIKTNSYEEPICIYTNYQTNGIGSRGNSWEGIEGNLFFSFALDNTLLPKDLPIQSASIFFSYILKKVLEDEGSKVWLKWPNDFYIDDKKIGGTITSISSGILYCGVGLNLKKVNDDFGSLDISIDCHKVLNEYFDLLSSIHSWKNVFSEFKIEFEKSRKFKATINNKKISLQKAILTDDGSIQIDDTKVYSLR